MRILYDNKIFDAAITSSSENGNYPWDTALNDTRLSRIGKFTGATAESLSIALANNEEGTIGKKFTTDEAAYTQITKLTSGKFLIAYSDVTDDNCGKYIVLNADESIYKAEHTFLDDDRDYMVLRSSFNGADEATAYTDPIAGAATFVGTAQLDTSQRRYSTASLLLDGNSDYITYPDSDDWYFGTGDFTIAIPVRFANVDNDCTFYAQEKDSDNKITFSWDQSAKKLNLWCMNGGVSYAKYSVSWDPAIDTWYDIALVRSGSSIYMFIDGFSKTLIIGEPITANTSFANLETPLIIGHSSLHGDYHNGWIGGIKIWKGEAKWTSNYISPVGEVAKYISVTELMSGKILLVFKGDDFEDDGSFYDGIYYIILNSDFTVFTPSTLLFTDDYLGVDLQYLTITELSNDKFLLVCLNAGEETPSFDYFIFSSALAYESHGQLLDGEGGSGINCKILSDGKIFLTYSKDGTGLGKGFYKILNDDLTEYKAETCFHSAATEWTAFCELSDGKFFIAYMDDADGDKGKYIILNTDYSVNFEGVISTGITQYISAEEMEEGKYIITYVDASDSSVGKYVIFNYSAVDYVSILNHNLTAGATIAISGSKDAVLYTAIETITEITNSIIHKFADSQYYIYYKIEFSDIYNSDGEISIGYIFLGESLDMPGMDISQVIPYKSNSVIQKSVTGQLYGDRRIKYKAAQIAFTGIENDDKILINNFFEVCDITRPFILLIWEDDLDIEPAIYCHLTKDLEWSRTPGSGLMYNLKLDFEECF